MKKQIFYKQKKLKSQKSLEYTCHNSFNFQEYSQNRIIKEKNDDFRNNISLDNLENNNINNSMNNIKRINSIKKLEKYGKLGELNYEIESKNIILIPDNFNGDINSLKLELLPKEKYFFISGKNFQLIIDTLNEKEKMIKELKSLLEKYKNQKNELNYKINKINENNEEIYLLREENKQLEKTNNELMQQIEKKNIYLNKIQKDKNKEKENINSNFEKEIDLLKKDKESLLKMINQIKTDLNNNKEENEKKIKQLCLNFDRIKSEKEKNEKNEKKYYENKIKESEQNLNLLYKEIDELKNKNNILLNLNNKEKNKSRQNSIFRNLIIEKTNKIIIRGVKYNEIKMDGFNKFKGNDEFITDNQYITNFGKYNNNNINKFEESSYDKINIQNFDMLMILYNKSKQIEKYINGESDEKNNEL